MTIFSRNNDTIWNGIFVAAAIVSTIVMSFGAVITHVA